MTRRSTDNPAATGNDRPPVDKTNPNYRDGAAAFDYGKAVVECPHPQGNSNRLDWLNGWYGERTDRWIADFDKRWAEKFKKGKRTLFDGRKT